MRLRVEEVLIVSVSVRKKDIVPKSIQLGDVSQTVLSVFIVPFWFRPFGRTYA